MASAGEFSSFSCCLCFALPDEARVFTVVFLQSKTNLLQSSMSLKEQRSHTIKSYLHCGHIRAYRPKSLSIPAALLSTECRVLVTSEIPSPASIRRGVHLSVKDMQDLGPI